MSKYVKCGCVEKHGLSLRPVLCTDCNFGDDREACETEERVFYIYKKAE